MIFDHLGLFLRSAPVDFGRTRKKVFHNAIPHTKKVYKTPRRTGIFAAGSTGKFGPCHVCPKLFPGLHLKSSVCYPPPRVNPSKQKNINAEKSTGYEGKQEF